MPGPCSLPNGTKADWESLNEIVCANHYNCDDAEDKVHELITYRMWLAGRSRLRTGKTL